MLGKALFQRAGKDDVIHVGLVKPTAEDGHGNNHLDVAVRAGKVFQHLVAVFLVILRADLNRIDAGLVELLRQFRAVGAATRKTDGLAIPAEHLIGNADVVGNNIAHDLLSALFQVVFLPLASHHLEASGVDFLGYEDAERNEELFFHQLRHAGDTHHVGEILADGWVEWRCCGAHNAQIWLALQHVDDAFAHTGVKLINEHDVSGRQRLHALDGLCAGHLHLAVWAKAPMTSHKHSMVNTGAVQVGGELIHQNAALAHEHDPRAFLHGRPDHVLHDSALACARGGG